MKHPSAALRGAGRPRRGTPRAPIIEGEWEEVGQGTCTRCSVERRMYRPVFMPDLLLCSPCTQIVACSALIDHPEPHYGEWGDEDGVGSLREDAGDEVAEEAEE